MLFSNTAQHNPRWDLLPSHIVCAAKPGWRMNGIETGKAERVGHEGIVELAGENRENRDQEQDEPAQISAN